MRIKAVEPSRRPSRFGTWIGGLCALAVIVGACGSTPPVESPGPSDIEGAETPSPVTSPGVVASTPPSPSPTPTATPAPSIPAGASVLCARPFEPCDLAPGTYYAQGFEVPFTFKIGKGWSNNRSEPTIGEVSQPNSGGITWLTGVGQGRIGDSFVSIGSSPADFITYLADQPALRLGASQAVKIGSASGQRVDVLVRRDAPEFIVLPDDAINLGRGHMLRVYALEANGATVVLIVDAISEEAWPAFLKLVRPLLDSVRWRPGGA